MSKPRRFHHGNLREALLAAAREVLARSGHGAISLRELATKAGVAPSAPYRHFKNREALLQTLMLEGNAELTAAYQKAAEEGLTPHDRLSRACQAYIDYARRRPNLFQLIFENSEDLDFERPIDQEQILSGFAMFRQLVSNTVPHANEPQIMSATLACWSMIHGYAALRLHRRIERFLNPDFSEAAFVSSAARLPTLICAQAKDA